MMLGLKSQKDVAGMLLSTLRNYPEIRGSKVFVFGSQATGKAREGADIDIGIEGKAVIPRRIMAMLRADIEELPILYSIDVVDFTSAPESLRRTVGNDKVYLTESL